MKTRQITLPYGNDRLALDIPQTANIMTPVEPTSSVSRKDFLAGLRSLLPERRVTGTVAVVVADKTRLCGYDFAIEWLLEGFAAVGISPDQVCFYIAYGTHARQSEDECFNAYGDNYAQLRFVHHDCRNPEDFSVLGTTSRGTPVTVRKDLLEAELILTFGAVSHHYFAGFGGGRKLLFPGLGYRDSIYHNHGLFLDGEKGELSRGCRTGRLEGNPLAEDLEEVNNMLPPYLSIHGLLNTKGEPAAFRFGSTYADFLSCCAEYDGWFRHEDRSTYDTVIGSAGGFPKDINFIQAHKAVHNCASFVKDGGALILLAECRDGIGSDTFLPYFQMGNRAQVFETLCDRYEGNGGTALSMMEKTDRITIYLVTSLSPELCRSINVRPLTMDDARRMMRRGNHSIGVIPNGSMLV